ncbi:MAG: heparinase II/III family protein [Armatimonadota bacterium]|nr:MAG: heparinase II/III family protein [Armatimonadota bacterium]
MMADEESHPVKTWAQLVDSVKNDKAARGIRDALVERARAVAQSPVVRRVYRLDDVGKHRTGLDGRAQYLEPEIAETFALAMSDYGTASTIASELPLLAAAYRLTDEDVFRARVIEQLAETATWSPLQRPGWTLYAPGHRLPPDGQDGNWLATGMAMRGIGDALDLMPRGSIPADLRGSLDDLLAREIASIVDDWETKRPWFVRGDNPITNQWMLPTEGLVRACLVLGVEKHRDAYELGVANTVKALDSHGAAGEFEEGVGYAAFTITSMVHTAHAMATAGDRRAIDHPFLRNCPTWIVHHIQPGGMLINCFDAGAARALGNLRPLLSLLAVCTGSSAARWALAEQVGGPSDDLPGLLCRELPPVGDEAAPPLHASYERATRVNWRDSWGHDATGVWVRGGHGTDQHDHHDRGHVNFISRGRPILIEAGTPAYHNPLIESHYQSGVGHNVLQLGEAMPRTDVAPMSVRRLGDSGGEVTVDPTKCYDDLEQWRRTVQWTADAMTVSDQVKLEAGTRQVVCFRWHLGTADHVDIMGSDDAFTVHWPDATMTVQGSGPLLVSQEMLPDNTLASGPRSSESPDHLHTCIVIRSRDAAEALRLVTKVVPNDRTSGNQ